MASSTRKYDYSVIIHTFGYDYRHGNYDGFRDLVEAPFTVIDTRMLPAPHREKGTLSQLDGRDPRVQKYLNRDGKYNNWFNNILNHLTWLIRWWQTQCQSLPADSHIPDLHMAVGSKWGRHRSVAVALRLAENLRQKFGANTLISIVHTHPPLNEEEVEKADETDEW